MRIARSIMLLGLLSAIAAFAVSHTGMEHLRRGDQLFRQRAVGAKGDMAERTKVVQAVRAYRLAAQDPLLERMASLRLLSALYFQGCYAYTDSKDRLRIFSEAKRVGENLVQKYPRDVDVAYWYSVNLSLWANEVGPISAIRAGAADRIREVSETAMGQKKSRSQAGLYQVMGRAHHLLPRVPFLLSWPNKGLAENYLRKAVQLDPGNLANYLFLAEYYRDQGRWADARKTLDKVKGRKPRPHQLLEDRRSLWKMHSLRTSLRLRAGEKEQLALMEAK